MAVRARGRWDDLRDSLWLIPAIAIAGALFTGWVVSRLEPLPGWFPELLVYGGTPEGARAVLGQLASATITVVGLVFSLTVVALQMAASQFTPRLLRTYLRDRRVQVVLSGMLASAVYAIAVMQSVRTSGEGVAPFVPRLGVSLALLTSLIAAGLLVYFLHHVTQHLRVDVVMNEITAQTLRQLESVENGRDQLPDQEAPEPPDSAMAIPARVAGYLQLVDLTALATGAQRAGIRVILRPTLGDWVPSGATVAWSWSEDDETPTLTRDDVITLVHRNIHLGNDRTESADLAFGLRQLQDIATRALSPGVNDPTTAVLAIGQLSSLLCRFSSRALGATIITDDDDRVRVAAPHPAFRALVELAVGPVRRYGASDPEVLAAVLTLLIDVAEQVADSGDRAEVVREQVERVLETADLPDPVDRARIERNARLVHAALSRGARVSSVADAS